MHITKSVYSLQAKNHILGASWVKTVSGKDQSDIKGISPQESAGIRPQKPVVKGSQGPLEICVKEETETFNVLVNNNGSSVGSYTPHLIAPPKLTIELIQLPTLEPKRFLRDLRGGKVKQICVLVTEDEYVTDIRSATVFAENERVLSSSSMDESVLDD